MQPDPSLPDSEVPAKVTRRHFTAAEKARILDAYDGASAIERAAICRRERVYSSLLSNWRKQRAAGRPLAEQRGRQADPQAVEMTALQRRNAALEQRLAKAERVIDIQGKAYALLRAVAGESADELDLPPWQKSSPNGHRHLTKSYSERGGSLDSNPRRNKRGRFDDVDL